MPPTCVGGAKMTQKTSLIHEKAMVEIFMFCGLQKKHALNAPRNVGRVFVSFCFCICIWLYLSAVSYIVLERQTRLSDAFFPERWLALVGRYVLSFAF